MNEETFNLAIRTGRLTGRERLQARAVLEIAGLGVVATVEGEIALE